MIIKRFRVQEIAKQKGIINAPQLARESNVSQSVAYALWNNERTDSLFSVVIAVAAVLDVENPLDLVEIDEEDTRKIRIPMLVAS